MLYMERLDEYHVMKVDYDVKILRASYVSFHILHLNKRKSNGAHWDTIAAVWVLGACTHIGQQDNRAVI